MPIKVLVERRVKAGFEGTVWYMLRDLRGEALRTRGYLYGETWRSINDPNTYMVLSVWASVEAWNKWAQSDIRLKAEERMSPLLRRPSRIQLFEDAADPASAPAPS